MSRWDDDELAGLLRDTFTSREALADPGTARRVAGSAVARPRRWVVPAGVAAAVLLVAGVGVALGTGSEAPRGGPSTGTPTAGPTRPVPAAGTYAAHLAAAAAESERVVTAVALPDGAQRVSDQPPGGSVGEEGIGPSDPQLIRTAWWTVPASPDDVEAYLRAHPPTGFTLPPDSVSSSDDVREVTLAQDASPDPAAYRPVLLLVRWKPLGSGTVVRADTFTGAYGVRDPRSVLGEVTSVDVVRVPAQTRPHRTPQPERVTFALPEDAARVTALVDAFAALPASMRPAAVLSCPAILGTPASDTVTFHERGGGTVVATLTPSCFGQVGVSRDGVAVEPTLDPGDLDAVVAQAFGH